MDREQPLVQRDMRALVKRSDADCELVLAIGAVVPARPHGIALHGLHGVELAAVRANRAIRPPRSLKKHAGLVLVSECWVGQIAHGLPPMIGACHGLSCQSSI